MTEYFIRYSDNAEWLQNDLKRGYSFNAYQFADSPEAFEEAFGAYSDELAQHSNGQWGLPLTGLCGYGPFESVEEAEEEARNGSYGCFTLCGIYEGRSVGMDDDLNELFRPIRLVKVFDTQVQEVRA